MIIKSLANLEKTPVDMEGVKNAFRQTPISSADGAPNFSFRVFTLNPEGHTPYHTHPFEHMNYIIDGEGAIVNENGEETPVKKGDFALINPEEKHQYRNKSADKPFVFICAVPKEYE
jgi:quercetin dioxygenase-like cupin family protein